MEGGKSLCIVFLGVKRFELSHVMDIVLLGGSGGVVNSLDFCPVPLKSLACFYFRSILSS